MRVLIVYDVDGWAYSHKAHSLKRYSPADIEIECAPIGGVPWEQSEKYDLVFWLEHLSIAWARSELHRRGSRAILLASYNMGPHRDRNGLDATLEHADFLLVNNAERWETSGRIARTCCIANGIDERIFQSTTLIRDRPQRCLWTGSILQSELKGYGPVLQPLREALSRRGFECDFRLVDSNDAPLAPQEMAAWYNTGSYVLCASYSEGTPNPILEGMACGCVPVSTPVGNIPKFGRSGENCVIVQRTVASFIEGLEQARLRREKLSAAAIHTMKDWGYGSGGRAQYFYQLWRRLVRDGAPSIKPFRYDEVDWKGI